MIKRQSHFLRQALQHVIHGLLKLGKFQFAALFLIVAVVVSVMIVLTIDWLWDGRFNAELEFAGVITPFLDGLLLIVFITAMFEAIREEAGRRKAAERVLNEAQRIAKIGNWTLELETDALTWSEEIFRIFEIDAAQFAGSYAAFLEAIHPEDRDRVNDAYQDSLKTKRPYQTSHRLLMKDGRVKYVSERGETLYDPAGVPIRTIGTVQDITAGQQAEEAIRRLNEALESRDQERTRQLLAAEDELLRREKLAVLGRVAGSVGHELRNPLGVMSNAVYFLKMVQTDADQTVKEYLDIIDSEIAGAERIVSELLDSVRATPPQTQIVDLAALIQQTLAKCVIPAAVELKLDFPATLSPARVDPAQMRQVFSNLISNAVDAMAAGGVLEILAEEDADSLRIVFKDTGLGIAPENLGKLFQPLFTTKSRGVGLGLVVVKNLTEANGGRIEVESGPGGGMLFAVTLPIG